MLGRALSERPKRPEGHAQAEGVHKAQGRGRAPYGAGKALRLQDWGARARPPFEGSAMIGSGQRRLV